MKFTKEQQDYLKHCGEHFEILTGGRGHSKTKEVIEDMQQEIERLNDIIKEAINYIDDNTYYKDHKGHINIDDLYIILQKGSDKE